MQGPHFQSLLSYHGRRANGSLQAGVSVFSRNKDFDVDDPKMKTGMEKMNETSESNAGLQD